MLYRLRQVTFFDGKMEDEENHEWLFAALVDYHIGAFDDKSRVPARSTAIILEVLR